MAVYLNEAQTGAAQDLIGFPHLLICMGVVLQTRAFLYGCHSDDPGQTDAVAQVFRAYFVKSKGDPGNGVRLYGCGNWKVRYQNGGRSAWKAEMTRIAGALGYAGPVSGFDASIIAPRDGTYVEFQPDYAKEKCRIFYKRNEKMSYAQQVTSGKQIKGTGFAAYEALPTQPAMTEKQGMVLQTGGAAVLQTDANKGALHEVNYFLRLVSFTV